MSDLDRDEIQDMLDDLDEWLSADDTIRDFVDSLQEQFVAKGELSQKQVTALEKIHETQKARHL